MGLRLEPLRVMTLAEEINHVIGTPRVVDTTAAGLVYAPLDITAPGYTFRASEIRAVADDLFALAEQKGWWDRPTFTTVAVDPARYPSRRQQFGRILERARMRHGGDTPEVLGEETLAVWEEWTGGRKTLSILLHIDPPHPHVIWCNLALGSGLYTNVVPRRRAYWDLGVREIRTSLPADHYLRTKHETVAPHRFVAGDVTAEGSVLLVDTLTERP